MMQRYRQSPNDGPMLADEAGLWVKADDIATPVPGAVSDARVREAVLNGLENAGWQVDPSARTALEAAVQSPPVVGVRALEERAARLRNRIQEIRIDHPEAADARRDELAQVEEELKHARETLEAAVQSPPVVGVRALEWVNGETRSSCGDLYSVQKLSDNVRQLLLNGTPFPGWYTSDEHAKAAAQADYERRIRPALSSLAPVEAVATEPVALHVVFDGPPSHESGRFVEVETPDGKSVNAGEWHERPDGLWELRIHARPTGDSGALREALTWQDAATTALLKMKGECDLNVVPAVAIAQSVVKAIRAALAKGEPGK